LDFETRSNYTIRVRSTDQGGLFTEKTFTISVTNVNEAPLTIADSLVAKRGVSTVLDVLRNDSDPDGSIDPATVSIVNGPSMADVVVQSDGKIRFTPRDGFLGTTQFQYVVSDNAGLPSAPTDVSVQVVVSIYQNPSNRFDADNDKTVSPLDVLLLVNLLNVAGPSLPVEAVPGPPSFVDVNGDNLVSPLDVLEVINYINSGGRSGGEGEGGAGRTVSSMSLPAPAIELSKADVITMVPIAKIRSHWTGEVFDAPVLATVGPVVAHATSRVASSPRFELDPGSANDSSLLSLDEYFERLGRELSFGVRSRRT
jgi:hypothetical protein